MPDRILFVDDDANLLESYQRQLRNHFLVETAVDGEQGLKAIEQPGRYSVIVSDFRMPGMDGVQFLSRVREMAPDSVRMLLTGFADLQTATDAVNEGNIFRLLTKPCPPENLLNALLAGIKQYQLVTAERELLEKTLRGSIKVLSEILSLVNPEAFGRAMRVTREVREIGAVMGVSETWSLETAALLSQIGCIIFPEETLKKIQSGQPLTNEEQQSFQMHPLIASDLLAKIPRMEKVAEIIAYQEKHFDGGGVPNDSRKGEEIPVAARILKVALDFDSLKGAGKTKVEALNQLHQRAGWYDPKVLASMQRMVEKEAKYVVKEVRLKDLQENMILAEGIRSNKGILLVAHGQEITPTVLAQLRHYVITQGIREPIRVIIPSRQTPLASAAPEKAV